MMIIISLVLIAGAINCVSTEEVITDTLLGKIIGIQSKRNDQKEQAVNVEIYLGIPYAKPPVGKLRFRKPEPFNGWSGDFQATTPPPNCIQYNPQISNVFGNSGGVSPGGSQAIGGVNSPSSGGDLSQLFGGGNVPSGKKNSPVFGAGKPAVTPSSEVRPESSRPIVKELTTTNIPSTSMDVRTENTSITLSDVGSTILPSNRKKRDVSNQNQSSIESNPTTTPGDVEGGFSTKNHENNPTPEATTKSPSPSPLKDPPRTSWIFPGMSSPSIGQAADYPKLPSQMLPSRRATQNEDCLYLNIFVPRYKKQESILLPVLIWIHGGGFSVGGPFVDKFDGANLAVKTESIVVTFAYRLHVFGFFTLNTDEYPGNLGLWDQLEVMTWVKKNINSFGGDPDKITISGHSSGAQSVSLHVSSPQTKGIFKQAISLSGVVLRLENTKKNVFMVSDALMTNNQCSHDKKLECFISMSVAEIMIRVNYIYKTDLRFSPIVDGNFLQSNPLESLQNGYYNQVPYLLGVNSDDGILHGFEVLKEHEADIKSHHLIDDAMKEMMKYIMSNFHDKKLTKEELNVLIPFVRHKFQLDKLGNVFDALRKAIDIYTELNYIEPTATFANLLSHKSDQVYLYLFNHTLDFIKRVYEPSLGISVGAGHTEGLPIFLGQETIPLTTGEKKLSSEILQVLTDFLHNGIPKIAGPSVEEIAMPNYHIDHPNFLLMESGNGSLKTREYGFNKNGAFWSSILPAAVEDVRGPCREPYTSQSNNAPSTPAHSPLNPDIVTTTRGALRGLLDIHPVTGSPYQAFLGVPYAEPPIGNRRWLPTSPGDRWHHLLNAVKFGPKCPQGKYDNESEDCLHLNIWMPFHMSRSVFEMFPVLVYLHDGGFVEGSGNEPKLLDLAFSMNAIVVSINYRLGALGFLSSGTMDYPGNIAHRDILMALHWINEEVDYFRGDPSRVTLYGAGSGAALASQLLLSRRSRGLFRSVISLGGSSSAPWAVDTHPEITATNFAKALGCPITEAGEMMTCIQSKETADLLMPFQSRRNTANDQSLLSRYPWRPVNDLYINWNDPPLMRSYSLLTGLNQYEAAHLLDETTVVSLNSTSDYMKFLQDFVSNEFSSSKTLFEDIKLSYLSAKHTGNSSSLKHKILEAITDWAYGAPQYLDLEAMTRLKGLCYAYKFHYKTKKSRLDWTGPVGGDDIRLFMDNLQQNNDSHANLDRLIGAGLGNELKNFITNGYLHWESYGSLEKVFNKFKSNGQMGTETASTEDYDHVKLWNERVFTYMQLKTPVCNKDNEADLIGDAEVEGTIQREPAPTATTISSNNGNAKMFYIGLSYFLHLPVISLGLVYIQIIM